MKVLKFGGTSVGSAQRMKEVAGLISGNDKKIVVLSAMSGTTNKLVEIAGYLYEKENDKAVQVINELETAYSVVIRDLFSTEEFLEKSRGVDLNSFQVYTDHLLRIYLPGYEERAILAQGELISTALFQLYLEEQEQRSVLLPALNFMRIDTNQEPDNFYIKENLERELSKYPEIISL